MTQENFEQNTISDSKIHMFRCMIAIAHSDGVYCEAEGDYMRTLMSKQDPPLSDAQRETLEDDMVNPKDIEDLLPEVSQPEDRGQVVYFSRLMAYKDGELHPSEEDLIERLHANAMDGLDMEALRADVQKAVALNMEQHKEIIEETSVKSSVFRAFDRIMASMGFDL